ncbi:hypothetical protein ACJ51O_38290 (plasmid) [Burkholderia pyrrocinia]|uniref:hypothetical protein n=1 Tax=Burkholderia pyrrocinia TaxID=60550 RepID=UPI0038B5ED04
MDAVSYRHELKLQGADGQLARCPFCRRHVMTIEDDADVGLQFVHRQHSASPCPFTTNSVQPQVLFAQGVRNIEVERRNRDAFIANWRSYFAVMVDQVRSLSIERFVNLISIADVLNLWSFHDLDCDDVPYILLVLAEVIADTTVGHEKMWVRFVFEGRIKTVSDLWAEPETRAKLYRIQYKRQKYTKLPTARDIVICTEVERAIGSQDRCAASVSAVEEALFQRLLEVTH